MALVVASGLLVGCNVRPLPPAEDDRLPLVQDDQLPVFRIVRRIQCEAASAVLAEHELQGFTSLSKEYAKLKKRVTRANKAMNAKRLELAEKSDFGVREDELLDATTSIELRDAQLEQAIEKLKNISDKEDKKKAAATLLAEVRRVKKQRENLVRAIDLLREVNRLNKIYVTLAAELGANRFEKVAAFEAHSAAFNFEFEITEDNNLSSTGSVTWPLLLGSLPGAFTMGYDVGDKRQRLAKRTVKLVATFGELVSTFGAVNNDGEKLYCKSVDVPPPDRIPREYPITGNIGLEGVIKEYLQMLKSGKFKTGGESYTDKIQFTTTVNGALKPGVDLARKPGPTVKISGAAEGIRKDIHSLTLSLTPGGNDNEKSSSVQEVIIKQMPAIRVRPEEVLRLPP